MVYELNRPGNLVPGSLAHTGANPDPSSAARERAPIDGLATTLQDRIANLRRLIIAADVRFGPVCRAALPNGAPATGSPTPICSPFGALLAEYADAIRDCEAQIESLLSRCEL